MMKQRWGLDRNVLRPTPGDPWGVESKKISNDQELIQSDPIPALKTKREITKYINWRQFTKGTRGKQNEQLFPK